MLAIEPGTTPDGVLSASYYFRFYLARALDHAGMADDYLKSLDPWRKLLPLHFSTWPEIPGDTRSDSHAWSAHPIYDLLTLVAGIEPASPGFATVRIAPHLGTLDHLDGQLSRIPRATSRSNTTATASRPGRNHHPSRQALTAPSFSTAKPGLSSPVSTTSGANRIRNCKCRRCSPDRCSDP